MLVILKSKKLSSPKLEGALDRMAKARADLDCAGKNAGTEAPASDRREVCETGQGAQKLHGNCRRARPAIRATTLDAALMTRKEREK